MKIDARDGNTTRSFRPFTDRGTLGHFLDSIQIGEQKLLSGFIKMDGDEEALEVIQMRMSIAKAKGSKYMTRTTPEGLRITRLS